MGHTSVEFLHPVRHTDYLTIFLSDLDCSYSSASVGTVRPRSADNPHVVRPKRRAKREFAIYSLIPVRPLRDNFRNFCGRYFV
jgi:hypothetical protein